MTEAEKLIDRLVRVICEEVRSAFLEAFRKRVAETLASSSLLFARHPVTGGDLLSSDEVKRLANEDRRPTKRSRTPAQTRAARENAVLARRARRRNAKAKRLAKTAETRDRLEQRAQRKIAKAVKKATTKPKRVKRAKKVAKKRAK
jgi:hypothetical protein